MFSVAVRQFKTNWKIQVGTLIVMILSFTLMGAFFLMFKGSFDAEVDANTGNNPSNGTVMIFMITFFFSFVVILNSINLSLKLRWDQFTNMRVLGFKSISIKVMVILENLIISGIALVIAMCFMVPVANTVLHHLLKIGVIPVMPKISIAMILPIVIIILVMVLVIILISTTTLNKVRLSSVSNPFHDSKGAMITSFIFGIGFFAGYVALLSSGVDVITAMFGNIMYAASFACIGRYFIRVLLYFLSLIFAKSQIASVALRSFKKSINQNSQAIVILILMFLFIGFATNLLGMILKSVTLEAGIVGIKSLSFILVFLLSIFGAVVGANALFLYFSARESEYNTLRTLGYTRMRIIRVTLYQVFFIILSCLIFGALPIMVLTGVFAAQNGMPIVLISNYGVFFGMLFGTFGGVLLISLIPICYMFLKKRII